MNTEQAIANLISYATVEQVDTERELVRVRRGEVLTDWLSWLSVFSGQMIDWCSPSVGEQGILLAPSGVLENATFLRGLPTGQYKRPNTGETGYKVRFKNGDTVTHNGADMEVVVSGTFTVKAGGDIVLQSPSTINNNAPTTKMSANTVIGGGLAVNGSGEGGGSSVIHGDFNVVGTIANNSVNIGSTHTHSGVQGGGSNTGTPT